MTDLNTYTVQLNGADTYHLRTVVGRTEFESLIARTRRRAGDGNTHVVFHPPGWYTPGPERTWFDFYAHRRAQSPGAGVHVGYTMFETDRIDPNWVSACNGMDEIWVPTEFNRQTFAASGVDPEKLHVVPLGINVADYDPSKTRPLDLPGRAGFNFLSVFEWNPRKGYDVLLPAYATEFTSDDDVALFIRTYGYTSAGRKARGEQELREYFLSLCPDPSRAPKLTFLLEKIPQERMPALYAAADCFVLPTRGEGWGIPFMEAMAMGKPTIGTNWSAQTAFMTEQNAFLVDYVDLVEVRPGDTEYPRDYWGHRMAEPDLAHVRRLMREVYADPAEGRRRGQQARRDVATQWTRRHATRHMLARLDAHRQPGFAVRPARPKARVVWHAPLFDATGYADEARGFVLGLDGLGVGVRAEPIRWSNWKAPLHATERQALERLTSENVDDSYVRVVHISPPGLATDPNAIATIGRTMFETDGLPPEWVEKCNAMDEVWVPTDFNMESFARAGVDARKLHKVPESFNAAAFGEHLTPIQLNLGGAFVFLSVFDWIPRKGWDVLLRAYVEEFRRDEDVCLVLKAYAADGGSGGDDLIGRLKTYIAETLGRDPSRIPRIKLLVQTYSELEMARLYRSADAYVMATRGEGWGRPLMEAMGSGLPTIATAWGGQTEFMTPENSYPVEYDLVEVPDHVVETAPWFRGQRWAEPSIPHLRQVMRDVFTNRAAAHAKGLRAREEISRAYDRAAVAPLVAAELERVVGTPLRRTRVAWEGSQFVYHSLAHVNRELCLQLVDGQSVDLSIVPYETHQFAASADPRFGALAQRFVASPPQPPAVHVRHQWPPRFDPPPHGAWVMIQPWEFGGLPAAWVAPMRDQVDEVWVPSAWVRDCYIRSGVPGDRVRVIPNGLDLDTYCPDGARYPLQTTKKFKFLFVGGTIGRKGIDVLVDTYMRTFTAADDVCLVIKAAGADTAYRDSNIESALRQAAAHPDAPEIEYLSANLTDDEVASLYRACDALVHPYRGEGFGMPIAEAMACGRPVIVTGYGAALDFCDSETAYLIAARETPVTAESIGMPASPAGYWWAEPDRAELARLMRHVVRNPADAQAVGARAHQRMSAYSWQHIGAKVIERVNELATRTPRRFRPALEPLRLEGRRSVAFLHHPRWDQDGWQAVLTSYCDAFSAEDDVTLVLLLDPDSGFAQQDIVERLTATLQGRTATPDLLLVPDPLDDVARAYAAVDCLVPNGDELELRRARQYGVRLLADLQPSSWRSVA